MPSSRVKLRPWYYTDRDAPSRAEDTRMAIEEDVAANVAFEEQTCWSHDENADCWYFHLHPKSQNDPPVHRTVTLDRLYAVNVDYGENGQVIGVELI